LNIAEFELQERQNKNLPIASKGNILVDVRNFAIKPGQETDVDFTLMDCDGKRLKNKVITFEGTKGGSLSPSKITTDDYGFARAKFKMSSANGAYIIAQCVTKNVKGCDAKFVGSESLVPGLVKVEVEFEEYEEKTIDWKKFNPFAAINATGGEESEVITMTYNSIFYHKPSAQARKNNYLVFDEKTEIENYGSVSQYWHEYGYASYKKNVAPGRVWAEVGEIKVGEDEKGFSNNCSGNAPHRSAEVVLMLGDAQNPPTFDLMISFPLSNECIASSGMMVQKGDSTRKHTFVSKKITDPKSPYKTEYTIVALLDLGQEFAEGAKSIGMDFKGAAGASGYRFLKVKILAP
jgi:hypothetical protein